MLYDYSTRAKKDKEQDFLARFEQNIIKSVSELKGKVLNLKDIVIKNLQEGNTRLHANNAIISKRRLFH